MAGPEGVFGAVDLDRILPAPHFKPQVLAVCFEPQSSMLI